METSNRDRENVKVSVKEVEKGPRAQGHRLRLRFAGGVLNFTRRGPSEMKFKTQPGRRVYGSPAGGTTGVSPESRGLRS